MSGIVYIISAPSGSGKTTLTSRLLKLVPNLEFSISYTTRAPRGSEINGREYYFVSRDEFEDMIRRGEFLEYANVFGDYYGTARRFLEDARARGKDLVLDIDVQGAAQVKQRLPQAVSIFILPPSREVLERRLRDRSESEKLLEKQLNNGLGEHANRDAVIERRLRAAAREIENYPKYDYILVNDLLDESIDQLKAIVLAERILRSSQPPSAADGKLLAMADRCRRSNVRDRAQHILVSFATPAARTLK